MKPFIIDTETNIKNTDVGNMKASPYHPDNNIVALGCASPTDYQAYYRRNGLTLTQLHSTEWWQAALVEPIVLVGHNIGFDLLHIMKLAGSSWDSVINNIYIWDTQQVAYLLSGHTHMYPALDELAIKYGLPLKDDRIKAYWNSGVDTSDIPRDLLLDYLKGDVENTQHVFREQRKEIGDDTKLFQLVKVKMNDLLMTTLMEYSGMHFDLCAAASKIEELEAEVGDIQQSIRHIISEQFVEEFDFNPASLDHLSLALFGGSYYVDGVEDVKDEFGNPVLFKSGARKGQVKTRRVTIEYKSEARHAPLAGELPNKKGIYSTRDEVLSKLKNEKYCLLSSYVLELRAFEKNLSTYYKGYSALVWPDQKIHPSINHCSTRTGRQSCTSPNLQNVSSKEEV